jgi:hypothetical protein
MLARLAEWSCRRLLRPYHVHAVFNESSSVVGTAPLAGT